MSISLGGVVLDSRLLLRGLFDSPQIITKVERTLTGTPVPVTRPSQGRELTLTTEGPNNVKAGLFTRAQLTSIAALRDAGSAVTLVYGTVSHQVFLPSDCIQVSSITESYTLSVDHKFVGTLRLIEV